MYKIQQNTKLNSPTGFGSWRSMWLDYGGYLQYEHRMPADGYNTFEEAKEGILDIFDGMVDYYGDEKTPEQIHTLILEEYRIVEE